MSTLARYPDGQSQNFTFCRREFLGKLAAVALPSVILLKPSVVPPLKGCPSPEFWFGELVSFCWNDEDTEQPYSETGEIIGVVWNPRENCWEYNVTWLASTVYPADNYPIYDGSFLTAEELCKL